MASSRIDVSAILAACLPAAGRQGLRRELGAGAPLRRDTERERAKEESETEREAGLPESLRHDRFLNLSSSSSTL